MGGTEKGSERGRSGSTDTRKGNKTWSVKIPAGEILLPGQYEVATTCLVLVLTHWRVETILKSFLQLVKDGSEEGHHQD